MDHITYNQENIVARIRTKRKELEILVSLNGLTNSQVLKCSQELDLLIYHMQMIGKKMKKDFYQ